MGFGVRIGLGKKIGPFRAGVSVSHRGLGYGVGAGPFHLTGGTGSSSRSKSSSTYKTGISSSDLGIPDSDQSSIGVGCTGFSPNRVKQNTAPSRLWDAARDMEYNRIRDAKNANFFFLLLLFGSFPTLLIIEAFNYLFFFRGIPFTRSSVLAIAVAAVGSLVYGGLMLVAISVSQAFSNERYTYYATSGLMQFFEPSYRDTETLTFKTFIYWASRPLNFWGVFFFQALPLLPVVLALARIKALKKLKADALRVTADTEAQIEAQSELLESKGFPRVGTEGPRLLNEQEKRLIENSIKESELYFCACGYRRPKKHFFVECGPCRFAKNQASRK